MTKLRDIPIIVESGKKYKTANGCIAIKDGVKTASSMNATLPKPKWLRILQYSR